MTRTIQHIRQDQFLRKRMAALKTLEPRDVVKEEVQPKTPYMRLIEMQTGKRLEDLLDARTVEEAAEELGVPRSTIGSWRIRLGMRERNRHG